MTADVPTIAFDVLPGNSGPARYVAAIARGLEAAGWNTAYLSSPEEPQALTRTGMSSAPLPLGMRRIVPRFARCWSGFGRHSRRLARALRPAKIELLHTQNTGCEEMPVAARWAGVPRVLGTFHVDSTYDLDHVRSDFAHRALEWLSNRSLHQAIAVSEATKRDWMRRTGISGARVATIHNGIDPGHFQRRRSPAQARGQLGLPQEALILGGLGRLDPAKGFGDLIAAAALLRIEFSHVLVAIAGAGPLREQLAAEAAALGIADRVRLLGFQSDVSLLLDACDVFVLPSLCEALPFALLEAMAHELPAVGTTVGGVPEVIMPGETGYLSPPRDSARLAAAVRPLVASAELRQRLGRAGRRRVERHFHEQDMVRKTIEVYEQMLTRPPAKQGVAIS
jgi:glycosyltransferase involved in cell wall biosynthesis